MLSLVAVVLVIFLGVGIERAVRNGTANPVEKTSILMVTIILFCVLLLEVGFFVSLQMNNEVYLQSKIDTLAQENQMIEEVSEVIKEKLSDKPELLRYASTYFESKLEESNEQLNSYLRVRDDMQPIFKWLLYFGQL